MRKKLLSFVIPALVLFTACSKDDDAVSARTNGEPKLFRIYGGGELQVEFNYNSKGLPEKRNSFGFGRKTGEETYTYDDKDRLVKRETMMDIGSSSIAGNFIYSRGEYSYDANNRLAEELHYNKNGTAYTLVSKTKPSYDGAGRLISFTRYSPTDQPYSLTKFQYDSKGNIIVKEEYQYNGSTPLIQFKVTYDDFDDKKNPFAGLGVPPFSINKNNILQNTVDNHAITPGSTVTTVNKSIYKSYNSNGYPVEVMEFGTLFTYEYQ